MLFLLLQAVYRPFRPLKAAYLSFANITALIIGAIISGVYLVTEISPSYANPNLSWQYPTRFFTAVVVVCAFLLPLLFLLRRVRTNIAFTLFMAIAIVPILISCMKVVHRFAYPTNYFTSIFHYIFTSQYIFLLYTAIYFSIALLWAKRKYALTNRQKATEITTIGENVQTS
ncbi:hypothetical protein [Chitinophaga sp.]|uniref:hypothetical protein n=1 Tax=Chitinophaga sp. TaxID=1869181 RepID=UPI002F92E62D